MKKLILLYLMSFVWTTEFYSQEYIEPQWKFYFAFEDATSAKDTLWIVLDSSATFWNSWVPPYTNGWDPQFGEIPAELNEGAFNIWTYNYEEPYNPNPPKFKLVAYPMTFSPDVTISANNYILPITLSWDTTLFNAAVLQETEAGPLCNPRLESSYLEGLTNANWLHNQYSMIFDNHVILPEAPWLLQPHFPMRFYTDRGHNCDPLKARNNAISESVLIYPNPCTEVLTLRSDAVLQSVEVYNLQGQLLLHQDPRLTQESDPELRIDVQSLPPGMYLLHLQDVEGHKGLKKFVKGN